jgi:hypothetical protein
MQYLVTVGEEDSRFDRRREPGAGINQDVHSVDHIELGVQRIGQ